MRAKDGTLSIVGPMGNFLDVVSTVLRFEYVTTLSIFCFVVFLIHFYMLRRLAKNYIKKSVKKKIHLSAASQKKNVVEELQKREGQFSSSDVLMLLS